jgi:hypothetical protein
MHRLQSASNSSGLKMQEAYRSETSENCVALLSDAYRVPSLMRQGVNCSSPQGTDTVQLQCEPISLPQPERNCPCVCLIKQRAMETNHTEGFFSRSRLTVCVRCSGRPASGNKGLTLSRNGGAPKRGVIAYVSQSHLSGQRVRGRDAVRSGGYVTKFRGNIQPLSSETIFRTKSLGN